MTPAEIREAIAANKALAGVTDSFSIANALSVGRVKHVSKMVSAPEESWLLSLRTTSAERPESATTTTLKCRKTSATPKRDPRSATR